MNNYHSTFPITLYETLEDTTTLVAPIPYNELCFSPNYSYDLCFVFSQKPEQEGGLRNIIHHLSANDAKIMIEKRLGELEGRLQEIQISPSKAPCLERTLTK